MIPMQLDKALEDLDKSHKTLMEALGSERTGIGFQLCTRNNLFEKKCHKECDSHPSVSLA